MDPAENLKVALMRALTLVHHTADFDRDDTLTRTYMDNLWARLQNYKGWRAREGFEPKIEVMGDHLFDVLNALLIYIQRHEEE